MQSSRTGHRSRRLARIANHLSAEVARLGPEHFVDDAEAHSPLLWEIPSSLNLRRFYRPAGGWRRPDTPGGFFSWRLRPRRVRGLAELGRIVTSALIDGCFSAVIVRLRLTKREVHYDFAISGGGTHGHVGRIAFFGAEVERLLRRRSRRAASVRERVPGGRLSCP